MSARVCFLVAACVLVFCRPVFASVIPDEDWNYVDVRPGAHMFWWLYGSTGTARETRPLVLWLQVSLTTSAHYPLFLRRVGLEGLPLDLEILWKLDH